LIDNVLSCLDSFQEVKGPMKTLSRGLANIHLREGIISSCFDGLAKFHAWKFKSFGDKLIDWRWGSVISFCQKIEQLEEPFAEYWDPAKYGSGPGRDSRNDQDEENTVTVQSFSAVVQDRFVWAYARMLRSLLAVVSSLMNWVEWCPCRTMPDGVATDMGVLPAERMPDILLQGEHCPFAGRRGPELAAGALKAFLDEVRSQNAASLLLQMRGLEERRRAQILNDYNRGVQHFVCVVTMKFALYQEIPYKLLSIAHFDEEVARAGARECMRQWEGAQRLADECRQKGVVARPPHHLPRLFLSAGGELRAALVLFVGGASREDCRLAQLRKQLGKLLFAPIVES